MKTSLRALVAPTSIAVAAVAAIGFSAAANGSVGHDAKPSNETNKGRITFVLKDAKGDVQVNGAGTGSGVGPGAAARGRGGDEGGPKGPGGPGGGQGGTKGPKGDPRDLTLAKYTVDRVKGVVAVRLETGKGDWRALPGASEPGFYTVGTLVKAYDAQGASATYTVTANPFDQTVSVVDNTGAQVACTTSPVASKKSRFEFAFDFGCFGAGFDAPVAVTADFAPFVRTTGSYDDAAPSRVVPVSRVVPQEPTGSPSPSVSPSDVPSESPSASPSDVPMGATR